MIALAGLAAGISIATARRRLAQAFRENGIDSPDLDARLLVGHALALDHTALATRAERVLSASETSAIGALAARRLAHEPVARILGTNEFWGLPLALNAETLVPRPETETIVEAALAAIDRDKPLRIADLGTGTGALLLALLSELPDALGVATDISAPALACARANATALRLASRAVFVACDYAQALRGPFDLVVSNPPYIARREIATLAPEVRDHDPHRALDGGNDGLDAYRAIAADIRRVLAPGGILVVELGAGQRDAAIALFSDLKVIEACNDLAGIPRALALAIPP